MIELIPKESTEKLWKNLQNCFESEVAEEFLETLLTLMKIMFVLQPDYRRNIKDFKGRYQFTSKDGQVTIGAIFEKSRMKVVEGVIENPNITVTFRSGKSLLNFLLSPKQDVLISMLNREIQTAGNLNYVSKFGYMTKRLLGMIPQL